MAPGLDERRADEAQADRLELAGRKFRRRVAGPEAVAVARDDGEAGDLRVAHEIVDFGALGVRGAVIAAADIREAPSFGHGSLVRPGGQVLRVGALIERALRVRPRFSTSRLSS